MRLLTADDLASLRLLTADQVGKILHKSVDSVRSDVHRNPDSLPPLTRLPGTRRLLWHPDDVDAWLRQHSSAQPLVATTTTETRKRRRGRPTKAEQVARTHAAVAQ